MGKEWLSDEVDMSPYVCDMEKVQPLIDEVDKTLQNINSYCEKHPDFEAEIYSKDKRDKRSRESAQSYLGLENYRMLDITSSFDMSEAQKSIDAENLKKVVAYADACDDMYDAAKSKDSFLDEKVCIRGHIKMCQGDPDKNTVMRYRFRNERDPIILDGQGYFNPLPGEQVSYRMLNLFAMYYNEWFNDNAIVKGAKFLTEYYRIQPHLDGNKRTALMCLNFILVKDGYPDIYFDKQNRDALIAELKEGMLTHNITGLACLIQSRIKDRNEETLDELRDYRIRIRQNLDDSEEEQK